MSTPFAPLYIDGQERAASTHATFTVRNPYTKAVVTLAASASSQDCKDAVEAAVRAFGIWEHTPFSTRRKYFLKAADLLSTERFKEKVHTAIQDETAAGASVADFNLYLADEALHEAASLVTQLRGETFPSMVPGGQVIAQRRAQGVIFSIAPWNAPIILTVRAMAIPIICGNTVVLKSSEVSPRVQGVIAELFHEVGLPKGVLNFIHTSKEDAPARTAELIAHPAVRKITFTGSDCIGKLIAAEAARYLKPCVFELGGKAPVLVLEDSDIAHAARAITSSALVHSGQICMSTERVIVQRKVAPALTSALTMHFSKMKAGGPEKTLSALFTQTSAENLVSMLNEAIQLGAKLLLGDGKNEGAVVQPHIVTGVKPGMRLWERESFGPVIVLAEVDTIDEVIDLANDTEYSLTAAVWTKDINAAMDVAMRIRSGCVNVNGPTVHVEAAREHQGLGGATGYGSFNVDNFTDVRMIIIHPSNPPPYPITG
ncbi:hypothetical protein AcW1_003468 [Taiwanofungus camphoratus]|nr:hypothetical protein AcV5_002071 [Antrodia cinnamomea]KAI0941620.1 hypothetical protein AcW1_003468 [Antrodia cinnamomea]